MKKLLVTGFSVLLLGLFAAPLFASEAAPELLDEEPLMPEEAFKLSAYMINDTTVRAEWTIAKNYYMYRDKFQFSTDTAGVSLDGATAVYPKGKMKEDEFFGRIETYRQQVAIDIPVRRQGQATEFELNTVSQGCWDGGVCYPPQKVAVKVNFPSVGGRAPVTEPAPQASEAFASLKSLGASLGLTSDEDEFLQVDQAFAYSNTVIDGNHIEVRWTIADGYYLYRDKLKFSLKDADGIEIGPIDLPPGKKKVDESFGEMEVYFNEARFILPLNRSNLAETTVTLVAGYQGCAEKGLCYPPQTREHPLVLPTGLASAGDMPTGGGSDSSIPISEQDEIAATLASGSFLLNIVTFFVAGLLLAFTPCVFPMIPILSSIIVGQGDSLTTRKAFIMSLVYVLAMALTYTGAGIVAGLFGENLQAAFQNPWILGSFSAIFVLLSLSMFGFYELQMPNFVQSKLTEISNRQQGGTLIGVAIMGLLSALIVGPCVAAPLAGALIYIGQTGDPWLGGAALFALSMGMGAPLLAIGTSAGKLLPRAGGWMDAIKAVFGVLLLAVAIWMLERILPGAVTLVLWAALLIISAIYMGALEPLAAGTSGWRKLFKGTGLFLLVYGILLLIGAATGGSDPLQPLHKLRTGAVVSAPAGGAGALLAEDGHLPFKRIRSTADLDRELQQAGAAGKLVMLDFYADWCVSCKEMEKYTFSDPRVQNALADMVLLQADVTENNDDDKALLKRFKLVGPPSIMFFDRQGQELRRLRLVGFLEPEEFLKRANAARDI